MTFSIIIRSRTASMKFKKYCLFPLKDVLKVKKLHLYVWYTISITYLELMEYLEPEHLKERLSHVKNNHESFF